jgi:uncharacterized protein
MQGDMTVSRRRRGILHVAALLAAFFCFVQAAHAISAPDRTGWVTDAAGILDPGTESALSERLSELQRKVDAEVIVVTLPGLQHVSIETWGDVLGESWNIGRRDGKDVGVLLIVAPADRKVRIAVGYGLSNRIPDTVAAAIISDRILPHFRAGDFARGVAAGVDSIAVQLDASAGAAAGSVERGVQPIVVPVPSYLTRLRHALTPSHETQVIAFWVVVFVIVAIWMLKSGDSGWYGYSDGDDGWFSIGSWSSGGGSSDGGSSGGGSSGGGATGSW